MQTGITIGEVLGANDLAYGSDLRDALVYEAGGRTFVYAVGGSGSGLTALEVLANGSLSVVDETPLLGAFNTGIEPRLSIVEHGGGATLVISGQSGVTARSVALQSDGTFGAAGALTGDPDALVQPIEVQGPDGSYLVGGSPTGLVSYAIGTGPSLSVAASLVDTPGTSLAGISDTARITVEGTEFVLAVSASEPALTSLSVGAGGALQVIGDVGAVDGFGIAAPSAVASAHAGDGAFAIVAGTGSSSLSVIEILDDGVPILRDHVVDDLSTRFQSVEAVETIEIAGRTFVAAGGGDDGVSLFALSPNGRLIELASIEDTVGTTLANVSTLALVEADGDLQVLAAGVGEAGLTRLTVDLASLGSTTAAAETGGVLSGTALDDLLAGHMSADTISGGAGDDILIDGGGSDIMTGGAGADLFVFDADGQTDIVTDFELGVDRLDLSSFAFLYDPAQLTAAPQSWGVSLTWRDETIDLYSAGGGAIDISGWSSEDILNLDRPQFIPISQILEGDAGDNALRGGEGDDTIRGFDGIDTLDGEGGADLIDAGTGNDFVTGGTGNDQLFGSGGFDDIRGGTGNDEIYGGNEADMLYGDAGDDLLYGEVGVDNVFGGAGADTAFGGSENDRLWGGDGNDTLDGGTQEDRLYGEAGDDSLFGGAGFDRLEGGDGEDTLWGGNQADNLYGQVGNDTLWGEGGFDRLFGGAGDDLAYGGIGPDSLFGEGGNDTLDGGDDGDRLFGGSGNDMIYGGAGADDVWGGAGFDIIDGGAGNDTLEGNFNADTFVFATGHGFDRVTDFEATNDFEKVDLSSVSAIVDYADLVANHLSDLNGDAVIDAGQGDQIILEGVDVSDLDPFDFLF